MWGLFSGQLPSYSWQWNILILSEVSRSSAVFCSKGLNPQHSSPLSFVTFGQLKQWGLLVKQLKELLGSLHPKVKFTLFSCHRLLDYFDSLFFYITVLPSMCVTWWNVSWYKQSTKTWYFSICCANFFLQSSIFLNACGPLVKRLQRCLQSFLTTSLNISLFFSASWNFVVDRELLSAFPPGFSSACW